MIELSPKKQKELDQHLIAAACILYEHTESEKLKTFETIEWEVREQVLAKVTPRIGEFFFGRGTKESGEAKNYQDLPGSSTNQPETGEKARAEK
jgi:hypothetical protein